MSEVPNETGLCWCNLTLFVCRDNAAIGDRLCYICKLRPASMSCTDLVQWERERRVEADLIRVT